MGMTSLRELYSIFKHCQLHIASDGGSVHLADMAGIKVISIRTSVDSPGIIEPWNNRDNCIINHLSCSPCFSSDHCPISEDDFTPCIKDIKVQTVFEKVKDILR